MKRLYTRIIIPDKTPPTYTTLSSATPVAMSKVSTADVLTVVYDACASFAGSPWWAVDQPALLKLHLVLTKLGVVSNLDVQCVLLTTGALRVVHAKQGGFVCTYMASETYRSDMLVRVADYIYGVTKNRRTQAPEPPKPKPVDLLSALKALEDSTQSD
jgi:hypothetical protein